MLACIAAQAVCAAIGGIFCPQCLVAHPRGCASLQSCGCPELHASVPASPDKSAAGSLHPVGLLHLTSTLRPSACRSLDTDFGGASSSKRRRVRHQHFWRNSDKLPPDHRLYVASADIKLALEEVPPLHPERSLLLH